MRRLVTVLSLAALSAPVAAQAQIAEVELPPSDIADAGYDTGDTGYDVAAPESDSSVPGYGEASNDDGDHAGASDRVADMLDDPARQDAIADAMSDMMRALMTIRVGPIVDAARRIDPDAEIADADPDATIGDIASRGDPAYENRIEDGIRSGTVVSGAMIREFARMLPGLIAITKDLGAQAERAVREPRRR